MDGVFLYLLHIKRLRKHGWRFLIFGAYQTTRTIWMVFSYIWCISNDSENMDGVFLYLVHIKRLRQYGWCFLIFGAYQTTQKTWMAFSYIWCISNDSDNMDGVFLYLLDGATKYQIVDSLWESLFECLEKPAFLARAFFQLL